jgi:hypothetical protein
VQGIHYLMRKWAIEEIHGFGQSTGQHSMHVAGDGMAQDITLAHAIIGVRATTRMLAGILLSDRAVVFTSAFDVHLRRRRSAAKMPRRARTGDWCSPVTASAMHAVTGRTRLCLSGKY